MPRLVSIAPLTVCLLALPLALAVPRVARANGAFPESFELLLPTDRPKQIVLATNFGLFISDDAGATWTWTCERKETEQGALYSVSAAPADRFFAVSPSGGLAYSDDDSCTWKKAGGTLDAIIGTDVWPDPTNPMRIYAVAAPADFSTAPGVYASDDGGATFGGALFTPPSGGSILSIESARSARNTLYVSFYTAAPDIHPYLARSIDGGASWTTVDLESQLGKNYFYVVAVDPTNAQVVTARVIKAGAESLAISSDGGVSYTTVIALDGGGFTSYVRLDSGTILVGGIVLTEGRGYRSTDGGATFQDWKLPSQPHFRALAERGGKLYAAAKNYSDDWAVGVSTDEGLTFTRLLRYDEAKSIRACAQEVCVDNCDYQAGQQIWSADVCHPGAPPEKSGGCRLGGPGGEQPRRSAWLVAPCVVVAVALALARRRRRGRH
jgi:hypothetical protein